jgi:hypothetical protein
MRQAYVQKKLSSRHLCKKFDYQNYLKIIIHSTDIVKSQIAIGEGFFVYMPVINFMFRMKLFETIQSLLTA